jgi:hypothetical protein
VQIKTALLSQNYSRDAKQQESSNVEKLFHSLINEEGDFDLSFDEEELKKLTFNEAKELKIKLEVNGYLQNLDNEVVESSSFLGSGLLKVINLTYEEEFNKSLFEKMQTKKEPDLFLEEMKHNMEYSEGRRDNPWPNTSEKEFQGDFFALTADEIKTLDIEKYLENTIESYSKLLSKMPTDFVKEELEQSLNDFKELQEGYKTKDNEKSALLSSMMRVNRPNPLLGKLN